MIIGITSTTARASDHSATVVRYTHPRGPRSCPNDNAEWSVELTQSGPGLVEVPALRCIFCGMEPKVGEVSE